MTEESQHTWTKTGAGGQAREGPPVSERRDMDPASRSGHEGSAGQEPGDPGREA